MFFNHGKLQVMSCDSESRPGEERICGGSSFSSSKEESEDSEDRQREEKGANVEVR
jgi:hypothetical protein